GQSLKLLAGGGAIAGLSLATAKFEEFTAKILELATATDRGSESFGEQFGELFRTLPIVGNLTKGFDNLRNAATGDTAAIASMNAYIKQTDENLAKFNTQQAAVVAGNRAMVKSLQDVRV